MTNMIETIYQSQRLVESAKFIYWEKREATKQKFIWEVLKPHQERYNTKSLLSSAIKLCTDISDEKLQLVLLASALDSSPKKC